LEPFRLECRGIGSFKSGVLWLGVEKQPALIRLEIKIRNLLRRFPEIRLEHRKYHPHITLGRYDRRHPPSLESYLCSYHQVNFEWEVDGFELFSSQLTPKGAIHHCEQRFVASSGSS
jgi:2'-5' RNA ligase